MATPDSPRKRNTNGTQRRHNKPLIEKRRRARINECLAQLQSLVLKATAAENPRPSKLEKADILEMTVDYIKKTRQGNSDVTARVPESDVQQQYVAGYEKCIKEVLHFLEKHNTIGSDIREKISSHCHDKLQEKSTSSEPMEGVKCEKSEDEDSEPNSTPSSPGSPKLQSAVDVIKPEERHQVQNTAYVAPLQQQQQSSPETSPMKQATLQQLSGPIKLVCGGDILILLDSSSQNVQNPPAVPKIQFSQPPSVQKLPDMYPACNVSMVSGSIAPAMSLPVYKLSNIPMAGIPVATSVTGSLQPLQIQTQFQNIIQLPQENGTANPAQPLAENCHVTGPQSAGSMWRPW